MIMCFLHRIVCEVDYMGMPDQAVPIQVKVKGTDAIQWKEKFVFQVSMDLGMSWHSENGILLVFQPVFTFVLQFLNLVCNGHPVLVQFAYPIRYTPVNVKLHSHASLVLNLHTTIGLLYLSLLSQKNFETHA